MQEEWRPVVGWEGRYEVSSLGNVRRVKRAVSRTAGRLLRPGLSGQPGRQYQSICLSNSPAGIKQHRYIHQLVAAAFIGPRVNGMCVNHKDGIKTNNAVSNLEYTTRSGNAIHASSHGLFARKLADHEVRRIRSMLSSMSMYSIAQQFGINDRTVQQIRDGEIYSWLT